MMDYNNKPLADLEGFTPSQMHQIIYYPYYPDCPININKLSKELLLKECPIMQIIKELLLIIRSNKVKLTQKGNLPLKIVKDIYAKNYFPDEWIDNGFNKIRSEEDWIIIHNAKLILKMAGLIRKKYNYLFLTKKCETLLKSDNYPEIFYEVLITYTMDFNWAYNDGYNDQDIGQIGFLYSLYLLKKYGKEKREFKFYADLYFLAFPSLEEYGYMSFSLKESAYYHRFIFQFSSWFGFVEVENIKVKQLGGKDIKIKSTRLLEQLLGEQQIPLPVYID